MSDFKDFTDNGYILKRKLFSEDEISKLTKFIERNSEKENQARETFSSTGKLNMTLWNHPSDDLFGKFSTNIRIVKPMEEFLEDEVYHYHSKVMLLWRHYRTRNCQFSILQCHVL